MKSGLDRERHAYTPGQKVPTSGIYKAIHQRHRPPHDVVAIAGEEFPACRSCKKAVRFLVVRLLPHMTHDFDLAGPGAGPLKPRAKAAGTGAE